MIKDDINKIISKIKESKIINNNESIAKRLIELYNDIEEEDFDISNGCLSSLQSFYYFLTNYNILNYPIITLTPNNDIYISFEDNKDNINILFLSNNNIHFSGKVNTNNFLRIFRKNIKD